MQQEDRELKVPENVSYSKLLSALKTARTAVVSPVDGADAEYVMDLAHTLRQGHIQDVMDLREERLGQITGARGPAYRGFPEFSSSLEPAAMNFFLKQSGE